MNTNFKKKVLISFGIIFVSIIAGFGAIYYFSGDLATQAAKVVTDDQVVAGQNNALGNFALLKQQAPQAAGYQSAFNRLLPDQYGLITFTSWIASVAKKYNASISSNLSGSAVPPSGGQPGTITFVFTFQGPNGSGAPFLKDIEAQSSGFLFEISGFTLTNSPSGDELDAQGTLFFR